MEPPPLAKYVSSNSFRLLPGSSSLQDPEIIDVGSFDAEGSSQSKRKRNQVVPRDIIEIDGQEDPSGVVITGETDTIVAKNKSTMGYAKNWQKPIEDALAEGNDSNKDVEVESAPLNLLKIPTNPLKHLGPASLDLNCPDKSNSDSVTNDDDNDDAYDDDENYEYDDNEDLEYEDEDYDGGGDDDYYGFDVNLDAQFDAVDLPPGVEASVPWLMPSSSKPGTSSSGGVSLPSTSKQKEEREDEIEKKFREFKHFDTVADYSDHHYAQPREQSRSEAFHGVSLTKKAPKDWAKTIQQEWKILEKDLPETIFVRVYEERLDLLRAVIIGAAGTPYHDGLFFFDIFFPPTYPSHPPLVYYYSGGLRLNPNLYNCGKVCLSLLNTWSGSKSELWTPGKSTMLQVLVSIQGLVLNAKPYFNEPGYEKSAGQPAGEKKSLTYNEDVFILSCKTMMYTLKRPPKHFEDFVAGHFRQRAHTILQACKAYMDGTQVGSPVGEVKGHSNGEVKDENEGNMTTCSSNFKTHLGQIFPRLLVALTDNGADCRQFLDKPENTDTAMLTLRVHKFD
ncbi:putative ubiquitin-conjugating enzyme E2 38 isoform X1 [Magnolia sinica]|uniref:putative ubiquitin-conjugating enzyme E2 38 isoform X1 n=1 Tax=Magnolia sinica TaxID=86752 RepID=UPI00265A8DD1|nr:putative ubiquitin-conjugating enzyme E2 38 isoform X1 [Magnolia sinica]